MRVIAYGIPANEYLRIDEDTTIESVQMFAKVMIRVFAKVNIKFYRLSLPRCHKQRSKTCFPTSCTCGLQV
jgi:hypothetical protein